MAKKCRARAAGRHRRISASGAGVSRSRVPACAGYQASSCPVHAITPQCHRRDGWQRAGGGSLGVWVPSAGGGSGGGSCRLTRTCLPFNCCQAIEAPALAQACTELCSPSVRAASRHGFTVVPRPQQAQGCSLGSSVLRFWCVGGASRLGSNAHAAPAQPQPTGYLYQPSLYSKGSTSALGATVTSAAAAPPSSVGTGSGGCCASVFLALSRTSTKLPLCPGT